MSGSIPFGNQPSRPCVVTVRDEIAMRALQGLLAEPFSPGNQATASVVNGHGVSHQSEVALHYARAAYILADAMLEARSA